MSCCGYCSRVFRDNYNLTKHLSRLNKCSKDTVFKKDSLDPKIQSLDPKNQSLIPKNQSLAPKNQSLAPKNQSLVNKKEISKKCKYCLEIFTTTWYANKHQQNCKSKKDPIRLMEMENDIEPILLDCKTKCRFCNKNYNNISNLNKHLIICRERKEYHKLLKTEDSKRIETVQQTINNHNGDINIHNGDNNNITNNIVNVNILGHENMDHIQLERIVDLFRIASKEFGYNRVCLTAGNLINTFDNYIREVPENQNIIIPEPKSLYGNVRTELGWEKVSAEQCLNKAFKNSANELYKRKEALNTHNNKMFVSENNRSVFNEVKHFADNGLINIVNTDDLRQVKTSFKVSKLKDRIVDF